MMITGCQYIGPNHTAYPFVTCGCKHLWPGRNYCEEHVWIVYRKHSASGTVRKNKVNEREMADIKRLESIDHE